MNPRNFFAELKRRNVYKVAVAYAVIAWLLIQAGSILFPTFEAPNCVMKFFIAIIAAGFVLTLFLAWAFEMTPEGMKRTEDIPFRTQSSSKNRTWIYIVVVGAAFSIGLFFIGRYTAGTSRQSQAVTSFPAKSIAVLPLLNESGAPKDEYFY